MGRPERRATKKVKDKNLVESLGLAECPVTEETKDDLNIIDKGFYLEDKTEGFSGTFDLPFEESKDTSLSKTDILSVQIQYQEQLEKLKLENKLLKKNASSLTKNEEKLLSAIRSEILNQSCEKPVIGRTKFLRKLGMNSKYLDDSIKGLIDKEIIKRIPVNYTAKIMTYSWKILK